MKIEWYNYVVVIMIVCSLGLKAQIPQSLSYQGIYTDSLGNAKPDGVYTFTFRLYETNEGGSPIWTEIKDIQIKNGLFSTYLGDTTPFGSAVSFDKPYWLGVKPGAEQELVPRIQLSSVGYSFTAVKSDSAAIAGTVPRGSLRLEHLAAWTLAGNIGGGNIPANSCQYWNFGAPQGGEVSDLVLPRSSVAVPASAALNARYSGSNIHGGVCNFSSGTIILPNPFILTIYGIR
jgi:hypothetical protein